MSDFFSSEGMFAIYGAIVGGILVGVADFVRDWRDRKRRANFLAIRLVIALDTFVGKCAEALTSDPELPPDTNPDDVFDMPDEFRIPDDVDWTSIPHDLSYRVLSIPQRDSEAREAVGFIFQMADGAQAQDTRDEYFLKIGLDAAEIAAELRKSYKLERTTIGKWNPPEILASLSQKRLQRLGPEDGAMA